MEEGRGPREVASFREQRLTVAAALHCIVEMEKKESTSVFFSLFLSCIALLDSQL